jgi:hypothetical protein
MLKLVRVLKTTAHLFLFSLNEALVNK